MPKQKIRIKLKAYDHKIVDQSVKRIIETIERTGAKICGPIPLPKSNPKTVDALMGMNLPTGVHVEVKL